MYINMSISKTDIVCTCRKLQSLHRGCYNFKNSFYKNTYEVMKDIAEIKDYGDITSVRKTCIMLNDFYKRETDKELIPFISAEKQRVLDNKKLIKKLAIPTFYKREGKFLVFF